MLDDKKIYWRCRRGMLEIDLFLLPFFQNNYHHLLDEDKAAFIQLLDEADPDLLNWLMGYTEPEANQFKAIVKKIRDHAASHSLTD